MINSIALKILILSVLFWITPVCFALAGPAAPNTLKEVSIDSGLEDWVLKMKFARPFAGKVQPVFTQENIQVDLAGTQARLGRLFYPTGDAFIPNVFISRLNASTLQLKLELGEGTDNIRNNFFWNNEGRVLQIRIQRKNQDILASFLKDAREDVLNNQVEASPPAAEVEPLQAIPVSKERPALFGTEAGEKKVLPSSKPEIEGAKKLNESGLVSAGEPLELWPSSLKMLSTLALVLGLMFLLFYAFKKLVLKNSLFGKYNKMVNVLSTGFLGPKKSIALVEVAGEVLVLGISNDHISLLSNIQDSDKIDRIKNGDLSGASRDSLNTNGTLKQNPDHSSGESSFADYLHQVSEPKKTKDDYVKDVAAQIRKNLARIKPVRA